jgi:hypothetical protein
MKGRIGAGISVLFVMGIIWSSAWGSWVQVDRATKDKTLIQLTNQGSAVFLTGAIEVFGAMVRLDGGDHKAAVSIGLEAASKFDVAGARFGEVTTRLREVGQLQKELDGYVSRLNYDSRAASLASCGVVVEGSAIWRSVLDLARAKGVKGLFGEAANRANALAGKTRAFANALSGGTYRPMQGAALLADIGANVTFGSYVSVVFVDRVEACPR